MTHPKVPTDQRRDTTATRSFTDDEVDVLVRALVAMRMTATDTDRRTIDGILRDGWTA